MRGSAWLAATAVLGVGCVVVPAGPPDDGFRTKLAAGCHTEQACAALRAEASARYTACVTSGSHEPYACEAMARDKNAADELENALQRDSQAHAQAGANLVLDADHASQAQYERLRALQSSPGPTLDVRVCRVISRAAAGEAIL